MPPYLSIIVPARNDAAALECTLTEIDGLHQADGIEVIVAACDDRPGTEGAVRGRARLLWPGCSTRAALMNAGAEAARGEVLLFLHADSFLPANAVSLIRDGLADPRAVGGAFEHRFAESVWSLMAITCLNRIRYRITRNYYGDQGIFVRAPVFHRIGGYRSLRILEDLDFARRLKRTGRSVLIRTPLRTAGRRFLVRGPWRTLAFMAWLVLRYSLGLDTECYARRYHDAVDRSLADPWHGPPTAGARNVPR